MTIDQPLPRSFPLKYAEQEGFVARSSGIARGANPHARVVSLPHVDLAKAGTWKAAAEAWWRGWDRADRDLAQPRVQARAAPGGG